MARKSKYATISLPVGISDEIDELIEGLGYWPSRGAFVREAALEKLRRERQTPGKIVPEPILLLDPQENRKN